MLDTIYFNFIFKVQHYTTNIYHSFFIITWKIEMAPKELHIPQFLFFSEIYFHKIAFITHVSQICCGVSSKVSAYVYRISTQ